MHTASLQQILAGEVTDIYFERSVQILKAKQLDKRVRAEVIAKVFPNNWPWGILAGVEELTELLQALKVSVRCLPEGTLFRPFEPVLEIEGQYTDFAVYETAILGFLCQASGIATKAARCRKQAGEKAMLSFGARRLHPALAPMVERSAYIGGCDGLSVVASGTLIGRDASGTMPHALILVIGNTVEAVCAFDEVIAPSVKRVALIDTFNDEKMEAINVAEALGPRLDAVRLDTPRSRRGNFRQILQEVRWELDLRGYRHVQLFVSGGLDEEEITELREVVDGFGIGTSISDAPVVDLSLDIIEVDGRPLAKRGKWAGSKSVWRCSACYSDTITSRGAQPSACPCGGTQRDLLEQLTEEGRIVGLRPSAEQIRQAVLDQLQHVQT
ncbi:MAG: nicotinate phosphoribosyltransferase [Chloroflexota bacterium]|nr:MAG: nicotinate phosphoribosyltransferase [Chloroflexota bacterium]